MKKLSYSILAAALLTVAGALLTTACSNDDNDTPTVKGTHGQTVTFTATLAPKGGAMTRAITTGTDADGKETLITAWEVGEEIGIYHDFGPAYHTATATVQTVNPDGSATIIADFHYTPMDGSTAKFVYPAYLMDDSGEVDFDATKEGFGLCHQYGYLTGEKSISLGTSVSERGGADICIGYGTLAAEGDDVTVNGAVTMENEVCICKFHFDFVSGEPSTTDPSFDDLPNQSIEPPSYSPITINDGAGHTYTIESDREDSQSILITLGGRGFYSTEDIYVAMLPIEHMPVTFTATSFNYTGTYRCTIQAHPDFSVADPTDLA